MWFRVFFFSERWKQSLFLKCITCTQFFLFSIAFYNCVPPLFFLNFKIVYSFLQYSFYLPSLTKLLLPERRSAWHLVAFSLHLGGNGPSNDGFCRAGAKTPPCILELQPLCTSCQGVRECYRVCEAVRVTDGCQCCLDQSLQVLMWCPGGFF